MIYTVTLNPSLDRTISIPKFTPGAIHRAELVRLDYGGKGINVSRALRKVNVSSTIVAAIGGMTGEILHQGLRADGFDTHPISALGETRQNITMINQSTDDCDKFNEPGATLPGESLDGLRQYIAEHAEEGSLWAFCGSLPPGSPSSLYSDFIQLVQRKGGKAFLDTSGPALAEGLSARPFCVKPNIEELHQINPALPDHDFSAGLNFLGEHGVPLAVVSDGRRGLSVSFEGENWLAIPPDVVVRSNIGAGDAALAGLIWGIGDHQPAKGLACRAAACGAACAMQDGTGMGDLELIKGLMKKTKMVSL
jgi:1-phosphofructokinase